jgi:hypothetical protein
MPKGYAKVHVFYVLVSSFPYKPRGLNCKLIGRNAKSKYLVYNWNIIVFLKFFYLKIY